jgi:hypothetical protein
VIVDLHVDEPLISECLINFFGHENR